ncbi:evolutionarily conserved signaling intermediate in Toll pathway, mitochondrial [Megalops cyprinoides]|uniref:evolutionarily conserved signaling intermediate in Toll pathway, mitochondrial n=1 Tax=Megalops cyprinoides TaxID=118141 RepID=UPI0018653978|nr:evolutionarily conserved signaling intermediate in Toll pathway, mitochondrial [Megalops cyprinoides]
MRCARSLVRIQSLRALPGAVGGTVQPAAPRNAPPRNAPHARSLTVRGPCGQALRSLHTGCVLLKNRPVATDYQEKSEREGGAGKSLVTYDDLFERAALEAKTKATFNQVLDVFVKRDIRRRGHVEFIYAALRKMPEFGVERDLEVYNKLLDVFPKEIFVPRNFIQRMFNHYPRQQECGVQVLEQMENYGIMPNVQTKVLLVQIFGEKSHPVRKYQRLLYWFPRFKHANPFPVPHQLPEDPVDLARFSLSRIANDLDARVTVYQLPYTDVRETGEEVTQPYVVGIQSPDQRHLLAKHNPSRPVFVEGPFPLWLRKTCVYYYVLRADPLPPEEKVEEPVDPERCFYYPLQLELDLERDLGDNDSFDVDEVDEGLVFAMCMAGQGDQATLAKWISGLQETNPILGRTATVFRLESGVRELQSTAEPEPETGPSEEEEVLQSRGMKQ